jgi:DNA (cytosine-5)-methyltransferase 1
MGFPDTYRIPVSDTQAYRQFGNSVVMPVMREVARAMLPHLDAIRAGGTQARDAAAVAAAAAAAVQAPQPTQQAA